MIKIEKSNKLQLFIDCDEESELKAVAEALNNLRNGKFNIMEINQRLDDIMNVEKAILDNEHYKKILNTRLFVCNFRLKNKYFGTEKEPFYRSGCRHFPADANTSEDELHNLALKVVSKHERVEPKHIEIVNIVECETIEGLKELLSKN